MSLQLNRRVAACRALAGVVGALTTSAAWADPFVPVTDQRQIYLMAEAGTGLDTFTWMPGFAFDSWNWSWGAFAEDWFGQGQSFASASQNSVILADGITTTGMASAQPNPNVGACNSAQGRSRTQIVFDVTTRGRYMIRATLSEINQFQSVKVELRRGTGSIVSIEGATGGAVTRTGVLSPGRYTFEATADVSLSACEPDYAEGRYEVNFSMADAPCESDFTGDGFVDDSDFVIFADAYGDFTIPPANPAADLTADGFVDDSDFVIFAAAYADFEC